MKFFITMLGDLYQLFHVPVLDYDDVVSPVSKSYGKIKMYGYLWAVGFVDHCVIAHSTHEGNVVPMTKHTVTQMVFWFVTFFVEVFSKTWHNALYSNIKIKVKKKPTEVGFLFYLANQALNLLLRSSSCSARNSVLTTKLRPG